MSYYLVEAACGHVGRGKYVPIVFPVEAMNAEQAKKICRAIPRVKHTSKYAIISIREVSRKRFFLQVSRNWKNEFLLSRTRRDYLLSENGREVLSLEDLKKKSNVKRKKKRDYDDMSPRISKKTYTNRYSPLISKEEMRREAMELM